MRSLSGILFLFMVAKLPAQYDTLRWARIDSLQAQQHVYVKMAPLSLLGIYAGPSVRGGVEYNLKNNDCSVYHEAGVFLLSPGFTLKTEVKRYLDPEDINTGRYVSLEFYYKYQQYKATDSISRFVNNQFKPYEKNYPVVKHVE